MRQEQEHEMSERALFQEGLSQAELAIAGAEQIISDPRQKEYSVRVDPDILPEMCKWLKATEFREVRNNMRERKKKGMPDPNQDLLPLVKGELNSALDREVVEGQVELRLNIRSVVFMARMYDTYLAKSRLKERKEKVRSAIFTIAHAMVEQNTDKI